jgi:hypothetical protein
MDRNAFYYDSRGNLTIVLCPDNGLTYTPAVRSTG